MDTLKFVTWKDDLLIFWGTKFTVLVSPAAGINGGYYAGALPVQQAHSTTPHEVPHSVAQPPGAAAAPASAAGAPVLSHAIVSIKTSI